MRAMFQAATSFNGDLSKWDTRSKSAEATKEWVEANNKRGAKIVGRSEL